jgi:hypothetical protein
VPKSDYGLHPIDTKVLKSFHWKQKASNFKYLIMKVIYVAILLAFVGDSTSSNGSGLPKSPQKLLTTINGKILFDYKL